MPLSPEQQARPDQGLSAPPQPDQRFYIKALEDDLAQANNNRRYLHALLLQLQEEFRQAQEMWHLERESLIADRHQTED